MPDLPVVLIVQRLADRTMADLEDLVDEAFDAMCAAMTSPARVE